MTKEQMLLRLQTDTAPLDVEFLGRIVCMIKGFEFKKARYWRNNENDDVLIFSMDPEYISYETDRRPDNSIDVALSLAIENYPRQWSDILHRANSILGKRHHWHMTWPKPGQEKEMPLAILEAIIESMIK